MNHYIKKFVCALSVVFFTYGTSWAEDCPNYGSIIDKHSQDAYQECRIANALESIAGSMKAGDNAELPLYEKDAKGNIICLKNCGQNTEALNEPG